MRTQATAIITSSTMTAGLSIYFALKHTLESGVVWGLVALAVFFSAFFMWRVQNRQLVAITRRLETRDRKLAILRELQDRVVKGTHLLSDCYRTQFEYESQWTLKWHNEVIAFLEESFPEEVYYFWLENDAEIPNKNCDALRLVPLRMHGANILVHDLHNLKAIIDRQSGKLEEPSHGFNPATK